MLPVYGFNSAKYDTNLINTNLLPVFVNEKHIELTVTKKASLFISFKLDDIQLLDIMIFFGRATSLDFFLKTQNTKETKQFLPHEWFDCKQKLNNKKLPPYDSFFSFLRNSNLKKDYSDIENLVNSSLS